MNDSFAFYVQRYFSSYLIAQRNYGSNTISSYRDTFRLLLIYLKDSGHKNTRIRLAEVDRDCILGFLGWLKSIRNNAGSTRNTRLAHIRSFYGYVLVIAPEFSDQCSQVINMAFSKAEKKLPECMSEDEVFHFLHSIDSGSKEGIRHLAILSLLYDSGCRIQELIDANVSDVLLKGNSRIYVKGKGNKYRTIPLLPDVCRILQRYIREYSLAGAEALFTNKQGQRLTRQGVRYIMQKYQERVHMEYPDELTGNLSPHLLRHSKATHLVNAGVNIYNVRDFLGHASVITTQVYLTTNPEVTRKAIEQASSQTVPDSSQYYSVEEQEELMTFLDTLA